MAGIRLNSFANVGTMCREDIDPQYQLCAGGYWYRKVQWRNGRMACQPWTRSARRYRAALLSGLAGWGRLFSTDIATRVGGRSRRLALPLVGTKRALGHQTNAALGELRC